MKIPSNITYEEFLVLVDKYHRTIKNSKYGQTYFNLLTSVRRDIADAIRGTLHDPFHKEVVSEQTHSIVSAKWFN